MVFITGDTHGDFHRFGMSVFPEQRKMTRDDCVIVLGDFGGVWNFGGESKNEKKWLDWLENKSYTTLFIDGNHENFDRLYNYPEKEWHNGTVHMIRPHVMHLKRGCVYDINGKSFFAFGGARSHDIDGGVLELDDPDIITKKHSLEERNINYRVNHLSWWKEEMPNDAEKAIALMTLESRGNKVDYVLTHDCPSSTLALMFHGYYKSDELNYFLEDVRQKIEYRYWFFGHYHDNKNATAQERLLYEQIVRIV